MTAPGDRRPARVAAAGLELPALGLGTAPLGWLYESVDAPQAAGTLRAAVAAGLRYVDTAPSYGLGVAERRTGSALRDVRHQVVLSTKVGRVLRPPADGESAEAFPGAPRLRCVPDFSADGIRRSLEESLERLGVDRVDVVYLHDADDFEDEVYRSAYPALARLRDEGLVRAIGVGMNQSAMPARFVERLDVDLVLLAGRYNLLDQSALGDLLPACARRGTGVVVGGVFGSGILADPRPGARYGYRPADPAVLARARRVQEVCRRHGVPLTTAALRFPLGHPSVVNVLVGMRHPDEVAANTAAFGRAVPAGLWADLTAEGLLDPHAPVPESSAPALTAAVPHPGR